MNTVIAGSMGTIWAVILVLMLSALAGFTFWGNTPGSKVLTDAFSEPLDGVKTAAVAIDAGDGNLTVDRLAGEDPVLAGGTLEYTEKQGLPIHTLDASSGQATLTLRGAESAQPWFRLPWAACNGATEWQIHLNAAVHYEITAHTDGGNVKLDLTGMDVTRVTADTGGGNMDVALPSNAVDLDIAAKTGAGNVTVGMGSGLTGSSTVSASSGAGNVTVHVPNGVAARIHATSGMGKVIVDPQYAKLDGTTYQSPGYDEATNKVEITVRSGAGNVTVDIL